MCWVGLDTNNAYFGRKYVLLYAKLHFPLFVIAYACLLVCLYCSLSFPYASYHQYRPMCVWGAGSLQALRFSHTPQLHTDGACSGINSMSPAMTLVGASSFISNMARKVRKKSSLDCFCKKKVVSFFVAYRLCHWQKKCMYLSYELMVEFFINGILHHPFL